MFTTVASKSKNQTQKIHYFETANRHFPTVPWHFIARHLIAVTVIITLVLRLLRTLNYTNITQAWPF